MRHAQSDDVVTHDERQRRLGAEDHQPLVRGQSRLKRLQVEIEIGDRESRCCSGSRESGVTAPGFACRSGGQIDAGEIGFD